MAVTDWSTTAAANITIDGINIDENCAPGNLNDSDRAIMANVAKAIGTSNLGTLPTGSTNSLDTSRTANGASDGTTQWYGNVHRIHLASTNPWNFGRNSYLGVHLDGSGVVANADVIHGYVWGATGSTLTNGQGIAAHFRLDTGATLTNEFDFFRAVSGTYAGTATAAKVVGFSVGDIGDATRINTAVGVEVPDLAASALSKGIRLLLTAASTKYAIASEGSAQSIHLGKFAFGKTTAPAEAVDVTGNVIATGEITSTGSRIGYSAGAGGQVVQATSKSTGVALNHAAGQITLNNAALASNTTVTFTMTNSLCASTDVIIINVQSGAATPGTYQVWASNIATGSFGVNVRNISGGSLSEALVLNYVIIKGANL